MNKSVKTPRTKKTIVKVDKASTQLSGLYQTPNKSVGQYKNRYYYATDTPKAVRSYDRISNLSLARNLFTICGDLGGAILQKSSWVVGPGSYTPVYTGTNSNWGDTVETWLVEQFFPVCSVLGSNYPFNTILKLSSTALDVDGDTGLFLTSTKGGFPQVGLVPAHRIGQRNNAGETIVQSGPFKGYRINDGVIVNDDGRPLAYRILGEKAEDDLDIAAQNLQLLLDPEFCDQWRGINKIARVATDWENQDEINDYLLRGAKLASSIGLKFKNESGDGSSEGVSGLAGASEDTVIPTFQPGYMPINGGEIFFLKAGIGEDIDTLKNETPSQNTEAFISRIQKKAMYAIGWPQELLDPSKIGGASVRLVQDLVRRVIADRQDLIARRARLIVNYAVAKAMKEGILPTNNLDWYKWSFTRGAALTVDNGNEQNALREGYKLGTNTLQDIASMRGVDWYEMRNQSQKETEDLITRAQALSKKYSLPFQVCLELLSQRSPNPQALASIDTSTAGETSLTE